MQEPGLNYEYFIRSAFGFAGNGEMIERSGDPADLAEAGLLSNSNLAEAKAAIAYSSIIFTTAVINHVENDLEDGEYTRLTSYAQQVIDAENAALLNDIINEFRETVLDKYFITNNGVMSLK